MKMDLCSSLEIPRLIFSTDAEILKSNGALLLIPPKKLTKAYYRCDNKFHLDDILEMFIDDNKYGIMLISGEETRYYLVNQTGSHCQYTLLKKLETNLPNKHKTGGQSAVRFERNRDIAINHYVTKIVQDAIEIYTTNNHTEIKIKKLILAGYGGLQDTIKNNVDFNVYFSKYLFDSIPINAFPSLIQQVQPFQAWRI